MAAMYDKAGGRPPGMPKTGGRQVGTANKRRSVLKELFDLGKNPVEEILKLLPDLEPDKRAEVWVRMLSYCYPQLKSVEVSAELTANVSATPDNVAALCRIARETIEGEILDVDANIGQLPENATPG